jgi:hypothetical protein
MNKTPAAAAARKSSAPVKKQASPIAREPSPLTADGPPFTPAELSEHLWDRWRIQRSARRLGQLRLTGGGPPFQRDGNVVIYPRKLADQWAVEMLGAPVTSTSEEAARRIAAGKDRVRPHNNFRDKIARETAARRAIQETTTAVES